MYSMSPVVRRNQWDGTTYPPGIAKYSVDQNSWWYNDPMFVEKPLPEAIALETRQEEILAQLADLKNQLNCLREHLKKPHAGPGHSVFHSGSTPSKDGIPEEIVIKANPQWPPYSLLAFYRLSQNSLNIQNHKHSGTDCMSHDLLKQFEKKSLSSPLVNIRLIWKNVADTELVVSPTKHSVICGEVNVLRFLSRVGPTNLNYELYGDLVLTSVADHLLDICNLLLREKTAKARQTHLKVLSAQLQKSPFLMGQALSIVDMAAWSALKQIGYTTSKDLSAGLGRWFQTCNEEFEIAL